MMTCPHLGGKFKFENLKSTLNASLNDGTKACITHLGDVFGRENTKAIRVKQLLDLTGFYNKYEV